MRKRPQPDLAYKVKQNPSCQKDDSEPLSKPLAEYRAQANCIVRQSVKCKTDLSFESDDDSGQDADYKLQKKIIIHQIQMLLIP